MTLTLNFDLVALTLTLNLTPVALDLLFSP
jgi:hypothetical protein